MKNINQSHVLKMRLTAAFYKAMVMQLQGLQNSLEKSNNADSTEIKKES